MNKYTEIANRYFQLEAAGLICPMCGIDVLPVNEKGNLLSVCASCQAELDDTDPEPIKRYDDAGWPYYDLDGEKWYLT